MSVTGKDRWLLVHHTGSLGDTILTIPALRAVRAEWLDHHVILLTTAGSRPLTARAVLGGDVLVDEFLEYARGGRTANCCAICGEWPGRSGCGATGGSSARAGSVTSTATMRWFYPDTGQLGRHPGKTF
jgi:hypothetical protein